MNCYASKTKFYFNPTPKNKTKIEELKLNNPGRSNSGNSVVFINEVLKTSRKCQVNIREFQLRFQESMIFYKKSFQEFLSQNKPLHISVTVRTTPICIFSIT